MSNQLLHTRNYSRLISRKYTSLSREKATRNAGPDVVEAASPARSRPEQNNFGGDMPSRSVALPHTCTLGAAEA